MFDLRAGTLSVGLLYCRKPPSLTFFVLQYVVMFFVYHYASVTAMITVTRKKNLISGFEMQTFSGHKSVAKTSLAKLVNRKNAFRRPRGNVMKFLYGIAGTGTECFEFELQCEALQFLFSAISVPT